MTKVMAGKIKLVIPLTFYYLFTVRHDGNGRVISFSYPQLTGDD